MTSNLEGTICHLAVSLGNFRRTGHYLNFLLFITYGDYTQPRHFCAECTHTHTEDDAPQIHRAA